jgi:hypothetical protein
MLEDQLQQEGANVQIQLSGISYIKRLRFSVLSDIAVAILGVKAFRGGGSLVVVQAAGGQCDKDVTGGKEGQCAVQSEGSTWLRKRDKSY